MKTIFIVEKKPIFIQAARDAEDNMFKDGGIHKKIIMKPGDVEKAMSYMRNRKRMADADEVNFMIFGFEDADFSALKDQRGRPIVEHKGVIYEKKREVKNND